MFYVALSDGGGVDGNIFLVQANALTSSGMGLWTLGNIDLGSVEVAGTSIIVGEAYGASVWTSHNAGDIFVPATKVPSPGHAGTQARVEMLGPYDPDSGIVLVFAGGDGSAVSRSNDGGDTFNAIGMIDGTIDNIWDLGFSPLGGSQPMLMITEDETIAGHDLYSIWRTADATSSAPVWERVAASNLSYDHIGYADDGSAIILQDDLKLYKSTDNAQTFIMWRTLPTGVGTVSDWIAPNGTTIYLVGSGGFYGTSSFGPAILNDTLGSLVSIAMYEDTILVGDDSGNVVISLDRGATWGAAQSVGSGDVLVDFDSTGKPYFATGASTVGTFSISSTGIVVITPTSSVKDVKDSASATATADSFTGLWVSPDDVIYAIGGDEAVDDTESDTSVWGYVELEADGYWDGLVVMGDAQIIGSTSGLTVMSLEDFNLIVTLGEIGDNENLRITGDSLSAPMDGYVTGTISFESMGDGDTAYSDVIFMDSAFVSGETITLLQLYGMGGNTPPSSDDDSRWIRFPVIDEPLVEVAGDFDDGDSVTVVDPDLNVDEDFPTLVEGDLHVQGTTVFDLANLEGLSFTADFGNEEGDTGDSVDVGDTDLEVIVTSTTTETAAAEANLHRLLIGESDNVWEMAQKDGAMGLWGTPGSNILWTIVAATTTSGQTIWALEDTCSGPVTLLSPADGSTVAGKTSVTLEWEAVDGGKKYEVKGGADADDVSTTTVDEKKILNKTGQSKTTLAITGLADNTEYEWKVRVEAGGPFQSRWSDEWAFTTTDGLLAPVNEVPSQGMQGASLYPSFVWSAVTGADSYVFELATEPDFSDAVDVAVVETLLTLYTQTTALENDQNYYWRVKAISIVGGDSEWCISNFHTKDAPVDPVVVEQVTTPAPIITLTQLTPETPSYIWIIIAIGAILTIAVIVLIVRTRRVV
jgi:hypothetical protein